MSNMFKPTRTMGPEQGSVFFAMPFGTKKLRNGDEFDFDLFYRDECVPVVRDDCEMDPVRVDGIYGSQGVLEAVWRAMQKADLVVVDFTTRSANVAFEFGWALLLGKRVVVLTQDPDDIPTDVRGLYKYIIYSDRAAATRHMRQELAQELKALSKEPSEEMALMPMPTPWGRNSVSARVIFADRDHVFVQDDSGRRAAMSDRDVEYSRLINDMRKRFPVGTVLDGAFVVDPMRSEMRYTLLCGQTDPWPLLIQRFPKGTTLQARVENVNETVGAFVHVDYNVNGLVPRDHFPGSLPPVGSELEVIVMNVDDVRRRISLRLAKFQAVATVDTTRTARLAPQGWQGYGTVAKLVPESNGRGGYLLLSLPEADRPALLLVRDMLAELRADFSSGELEVGEEIFVEVREVDPSRGRTLLRELPEAEDEPAA